MSDKTTIQVSMETRDALKEIPLGRISADTAVRVLLDAWSRLDGHSRNKASLNILAFDGEEEH